MKFDLSAAWSQTMAMFTARPWALLGMAFLAIIVPIAALILLFFGSFASVFALGAGSPTAPFANMAVGAMVTFAIGYIIFLLLMIAGQSAVMALAGDGDRIGFGGAIGRALKSLPTLLGVLVIAIVGYIAFVLIFGVAVAALTGGDGGIGFILGLLFAFFFFWIATRLSLTMPVAVLGQVGNPLKALGRSWSLTGQSQWRLMLFYFLLAVVAIVLFLLVAVIFGGLGAAAFATQSGGAIGLGMIIGIVLYIAVYLMVIILSVNVVAASYYQLAGTSAEDVSATFE